MTLLIVSCRTVGNGASFEARAAEAMEKMLFGDIVDVRTPQKKSLAASSAALSAVTVIDIVVTGDSVGRPGLDPGTLGLKEACGWLSGVGLVAHVVCFRGNVLSRVGFVSRCCRNMRPKMRPVSGHQRSQERTIQRLQKFIEYTYTGTVTMSAVKTVGELVERMRFAAPPSEDDVTILLDGRRIDSKEAAEQWLVEVDAIRTSRAALNDPN